MCASPNQFLDLSGHLHSFLILFKSDLNMASSVDFFIVNILVGMEFYYSVMILCSKQVPIKPVTSPTPPWIKVDLFSKTKLRKNIKLS